MTVEDEQRPPAQDSRKIALPMGPSVLLFGVLGIAAALTPAVLLLPDMPCLPKPWSVVLPGFWACVVGIPLTRWWSDALHKRIDELQPVTQEPEDRGRGFPQRIPWIPGWIGVFERGLYCVLVAADVAGGATFIGGWIVIKLAGGWQVWSKGTTYGRAIFFAGLLGNAMSVLFGLTAGLVVRATVH